MVNYCSLIKIRGVTKMKETDYLIYQDISLVLIQFKERIEFKEIKIPMRGVAVILPSSHFCFHSNITIRPLSLFLHLYLKIS